jgi:diketogulonate reductase-like aldo/keto reductase
VKENVAAAEVKLSKEEVAEIRKLAEETELPGARYGAGWIDMVYIESPEK